MGTFLLISLDQLYLLGLVANHLVIFLAELRHLPARITGPHKGENLGSVSLSLEFLSFSCSPWQSGGCKVISDDMLAMK